MDVIAPYKVARFFVWVTVNMYSTYFCYVTLLRMNAAVMIIALDE